MSSSSTVRRLDAPGSRTVVLGSGVTLSYVDQGDPAGVPLVLLHGYTDSWRSYGPLINALESRFRVIAVSQRGHGDSERPRGHYDAAVLAGDLADFLGCLGVERAIIVGHSMGSLVAQRFALDHPRRTAGLVLIGAFRTLKGNAGVEALWQEAVATLVDPVESEFVRDFQQSTLARPVAPAFFEMVVAESLKVPAHVWHAALKGLREEDISHQLGRITAPTLVLWGDRDGFCSRGEQVALQGAIPKARLVIYAGTGHSPHWEEPGRAAADIAAFLEAAVGAPARRQHLVRSRRRAASASVPD